MSRIVTISTASLLIPDGNAYPSPLIERAFEAVEIAGQRGSDLCLLPEEFDIVAADASQAPQPHGICEPMPGGPITTRMQELAAKYRMYVVSDIRELDGDRKYNTAAIIDRGGELIGKYRKTHLAPSEELEVCAGDDLPVFETDFGRIAVGICMDIHYPEMYAVYGVKGTDIILWPSMSIDYTGDCVEALMKARAFDNQVYFVRSSYISMPFLVGKSMGRACVIDPYARVVADTSHKPGVATATVDLDDVYEYWADGATKARWPTLKDTMTGMRRPELYGILAETDTEKLWSLRNPKLYKPGEA
jgi:predicted amidohydrolase